MIGNNERNHAEQEITLDSDIAELEQLKTFVDKFCEIESLSEEICYHLQIVLEELILNAMKYGQCEPAKGSIQLSIKRQGNDVLAVLSDNGIPFNPLEAAPPDLISDVVDRQVGGLGIHLVRNLVHSLRYERRDGRNYLYFAKHVNPIPDTAVP
jgi:anti-sigma regulatory factor (Ser/Thr protein kinase)